MALSAETRAAIVAGYDADMAAHSVTGAVSRLVRAFGVPRRQIEGALADAGRPSPRQCQHEAAVAAAAEHEAGGGALDFVARRHGTSSRAIRAVRTGSRTA